MYNKKRNEPRIDQWENSQFTLPFFDKLFSAEGKMFCLSAGIFPHISTTGKR